MTPLPWKIRSSRSGPARARFLSLLLGSAVVGSALFALAAQTSPSSGWQFEAEAARGTDGQPLPTRVGAASAWVVPDRDASQGRAVMVAANGGTVAQVVPATVQAGTYTVQLRARGEAYQGWPTVELRLDGRRVGTVTLESAAYTTRPLGNVTLHPGQRLEVVFVNDAYGGGRGKDRNVVLDRLDLRLVAASPVRPTPVAASTPAPPSGDVLNVKTLGAKGDGVTDDTAALARIGNADGLDIYFPPGTYLVRRPVRFDGLKNQTVYGSGATVRASEDFAAGSRDSGTLGVLAFTNTERLTVRDLTIVGKANYDIPPLDNRADGLYVRRAQGVQLRGLNVSRTQSNGIGVDDSKDVLIEGNTVNGAYANGINTGTSDNVRVLRNTVTGLGDPSKYKVSPGLGIFGWGGDTFLAEGNVIRNVSNTATKTEGIDHTTYRGNTIDGFGKDGIKVMPRPGYTTSVSDAVVEGNAVRNRHPWASDGSSYILLHSVMGGRVTNNKIESTYRPGHFFEEDAIRVNAFGGGPSSRDITVEGNEAVDTRRGIRLEADRVVFRGNTVRGRDPWARTGLIVAGNGVVVRQNTFDGPVIAVLLNRGVTGTRVENNRFANHSGTGVYADNDNPDTVVKDNTFGAGVAQPVVGRVGSCQRAEGC